MAEGRRILVAHTTDPQGEPLDVLVNEWPDGTVTVAVRPGHDEQQIVWGPPAAAETR